MEYISINLYLNSYSMNFKNNLEKLATIVNLYITSI